MTPLQRRGSPYIPVDISTVQIAAFPRSQTVKARNRFVSPDRTRDSRAFYPAISTRIFARILLVIIHHIGNSRENCRVTSS